MDHGPSEAHGVAGFQIVGSLGIGADGARWEARDDTSGRPVELRLLHADKTQPRWAALVKRLRLCAMLRQPAILPILNLQLDDEPAFLVTELRPARTLAENAAPLGPDELLGLLRRLVEALAAAHRLGVTHGRLSPGTIFGGLDAPLLDLTGLDLDASSPAQRDLESACLAPEIRAGKPAEPASDLFALGVVIGRLWRGALLPAGWKGSDGSFFASVLEDLLAEDPAERPSAADLVARIEASVEASRAPVKATREVDVQATQLLEAPPATAAARETRPGRLGRFQLQEMLGEGGLGRVFRGVDIADGTVAAVKILHTHLASRPQIIKRFHKEARLLGEINNPFIVNLLEVNQDADTHFLALEFVDGVSLHRVLRDRAFCPAGHLDEPAALALAMDLARALADAHQRGIIHRDIKPQNIMLRRGSELFARITGEVKDASIPPSGGVKLCDFGLARHVVETDSLHMTQEGVPLGTPLYMSPEQAAGKTRLTPGTDIYALGATLYHVVAGRPPFQGDTALALSLSHANEAAPPLKQFRPDVSDGLCRVIERCLAKRPEDRFEDGGDLLEELERLARGEPANIVLHPQLPKTERGVREYVWTFELQAAPESLWPYVSNTERLNRAVGIPAVEFTAQPGAAGAGIDVLPGVERYGQFRKAGITNVWREHPFEWVEGRRLGVLREYSSGVFKWLASTTELERLATGGTRLTHHVRIEPRNFLGKVVCAIEVGFKGRRAVERVYRRIDAFVMGRLAEGTGADPFEKPAGLGQAQRRRLSELIDRLVKQGVTPEIAQALEHFVQEAPDQEAARIRPLALARRLDVAEDALIAACLYGARAGLLTLLWDIVCPICRIPAGIVETLKALQEHGHCPACQADFPLDFGSSVELIFRVHPSLRSVETRSYCIGGPAHSPHVVAQVRVAPGETFRLDLQLGEGAYRLRGPQLPEAIDLTLEPGSILTRLAAVIPNDFRKRTGKREPVRMQPGRQRLTLTNRHAAEVLLRVERTAQRTDALTAARASTLALFRELFPREVLDSGRLASVAAVTFVAIDLGKAARLEEQGNVYERLGEAKAFSLLQDVLDAAERTARGHGGTVIKTLGDAMLLAFDDKVRAARGALEFLEQGLAGVAQRRPREKDLLDQARAVAHHGPALATTQNSRLDYFGTTVQQTLNALRGAPSGLTLLSEMAADAEVMALLRERFGERLEVTGTASRMTVRARP